MKTKSYLKWAKLGLRLALLLVFATHAREVCLNAVDLPYYDEWQELLPSESAFTWSWLFGQHNEHRIVTTRLLSWINFELFGLNYAYQQIGNFFLYGLLLSIYYMVLCLLGFNELLFAPFFIFALSDAPWENHFWAFQSQFHFFLLFLLLTLAVLCKNNFLSLRRAALATLFSLLAMISFSAAIPATVLVALALLLRFISRTDTASWSATSFYLASTFLACLVWFLSYTPPPEPIPWSFPWTFEFWQHFSTLLSLAFGFEAQTKLVWISGGSLLLFYVVLHVRTRVIQEACGSGSALDRQSVFITLTVFSILAALAGISVGRAALDSAQAQASRYSEIALLLLPITALWVDKLPQRRLSSAFLACLWCIAFCGHLDNWSFSERYSSLAAARKAYRECVLSTEEQLCNGAWALPIRDAVVNARKLGINFTRGEHTDSPMITKP